jgi:hypothetical protein
MAEYVWIDAGGETRSKSRVGSLPAHFLISTLVPASWRCKATLPAKPRLVPQAPPPHIAGDSLSASARVNHDATAGALGVWLGDKRGFGVDLVPSGGQKNTARRPLRFCSA